MDNQLLQSTLPPPVSNNSSKTFLLFAGAIVLMVISGAGGYYLGANKQPSSPQPVPVTTYTPTFTPTSMVNETANWKTYTNTKYGFSIKYPPEMYIDSSFPHKSDKGIVLKYIKKNQKYVDTQTKKIYSNPPLNSEYLTFETVISIDFFAELSNNLSIDQVVNQQNLNYYDKPIIYQKIQLNGKSTYRFESIDKTTPNLQLISTILQANNKIYKVDLSDLEITIEAKKIYDQILSTFQFTQ